MKNILLFLFIVNILYSCKSPETYNNPILAGFYPDPSICKANGNYYLINSTFSYYPGIPIFESADLVNWTQIGHVLDRPEQLNLDNLSVSKGIFAPAISYSNKKFYVTSTIVGGGGNFIVYAENPAGPWSNPTWIPEIDGIDPSIFFDDDGKAYIVYNSIPPDNISIYNGHRTIRIYELDIEKIKVIGEEKILINGGTDITKKPIWIEGPHIYKRFGYYYLMAAEGGTSIDHSEVIFRSKNIFGPYESYENNPILTQRHLNKNRKLPVTCTGHADIIETDNGEWYGVFLGCREYKNGFYNTGRETFMVPVVWADKWPVFDLMGIVVNYSYPAPLGIGKTNTGFQYSGNFAFTDDFTTVDLDLHWIFLRTVKTNWYSLSNKPGFLTINTRSSSWENKMNPSFIGHRQQHLTGSVRTSMEFSPISENEKAGLIIFQNEKHFYYICKSIKNGIPVIELIKPTKESSYIIASTKLTSDKTVFFKIEANKEVYNFYYAETVDNWILLKGNVDAKFLSTQVAGGFVGAIYGMYTTSLGNSSESKAYFDWFRYKGNDQFDISAEK